MKRICLHGPESTGKSTLATRLAAHFGCEVVPEYGRAYCEAHGTDIGMAELVHIAEAQDAMNKAAAERGAELSAPLVLFDTDPLITEVWAQMMFGLNDPWFAGFNSYADLYLLLDIDLPFVDDGLRVYAKTEERQHFFDLCKSELDARGVRYTLVRGIGDARFAAALDAIHKVLAN
ncbi:MAG TPA: AAA family ATPase [Sphingorhabdus sp.]|jgi:NadR type nicotinamide-nucleotide adenylyltransferase|uniref:AAA family ATPase n=1 Tax=Sphingorhabdus sp. TaxID=1902408 RepID=UPI002C925E25|nr:AAA family ATPase [Sphingorhabdus sp.]HMT40629.1 AAA family ATPase [Sphingorhabdus sp.]HMU21443.1 AAA family ATPase [Sphingorhabdus sp.]